MFIKTTETGTPLYFPVWVTKPRLLRVVVVSVRSEARISLRPSLPTVTMSFATSARATKYERMVKFRKNLEPLIFLLGFLLDV